MCLQIINSTVCSQTAVAAPCSSCAPPSLDAFHQVLLHLDDICMWEKLSGASVLRGVAPGHVTPLSPPLPPSPQPRPQGNAASARCPSHFTIKWLSNQRNISSPPAETKPKKMFCFLLFCFCFIVGNDGFPPKSFISESISRVVNRGRQTGKVIRAVCRSQAASQSDLFLSLPVFR